MIFKFLDDKFKDTTIELAAYEVSVGRKEDNLLCINDRSVSSHHCKIFRYGNEWYIEDLGSRNGIYVNGLKISGRAQVEADDILSLGNARLGVLGCKAEMGPAEMAELNIDGHISNGDGFKVKDKSKSSSGRQGRVDDSAEGDMQVGHQSKVVPSIIENTPEEGIGKIDRYILKRMLGKGGCGEVYHAYDTEAGIDVALKSLPSEMAKKPDELNRVRDNFRLVVKLHHPNIASCLHLHKVSMIDFPGEADFGIGIGDYLVVMEYVKGEPLNEWKKSFPGEKVPVEDALSVCYQVAVALDFAHGQKIVHRDIKPGNVMITDDDDVKVLDFGIAAEVRASAGRGTETGYISGTPAYMPPEQWAGKEQAPQTDQYALAVLLYELLSGNVPFADVFQSNDQVTMFTVVHNEFPKPLDCLDDAQNDYLQLAFSKTPEYRYSSCCEFIGTFRDADTFITAGDTVAGQDLFLESFTIESDIEDAKAREGEFNLIKLLGVICILCLISGIVIIWGVSIYSRVSRLEFSDSQVDSEIEPPANLAKLISKPDLPPIHASTPNSVPVPGKDYVVTDLGMEFIWIKQMEMWVGKYEVTNAEYRMYKPKHYSRTYKDLSLDGPLQPVVYVNHEAANAFANWLTRREHSKGRLSRGMSYRLPSESEWGMFARCGDNRKYPWGNQLPPAYGNYDDSKISNYDDGQRVSCKVSESGMNDWGIYGVGGNVIEVTNISANLDSFGAWCGASWIHADTDDFTCAKRYRHNSWALSPHSGFRLVLAPVAP